MTTSARRSSASPRTVMRPGSPGPAPTSATTPTRTPRPAAARAGAARLRRTALPRATRPGPRRARGRERGTHHRDHGAGGEEALDLALGNRAATEQDARPALQLDEERKQRHGYPSTPAGSRPPAGSRSTAGTGLPASSARSVTSSGRAANPRDGSPGRRLGRGPARKGPIPGAPPGGGPPR